MHLRVESAMGINVKYIYSACIVTKTDNIRILHDPWFTEGIYDGSWFQFPKVDDPIKSIGDVDLIYISHIHPDHYDPKFLKKYFEVYGTKKILIADHKPNYLAGKMRLDGFQNEIVSTPICFGKTSIEIMPHKTGSISDIDSAIVVKYDDGSRIHCIVNANDIIFNNDSRLTLKKIAGDVDILLLGHTGAGPYPQTYFEVTDDDLVVEAQKKKLAFFERYKNLISVINARVNIPFAGKYLLGGKLTHLNEFRGTADPVEVLDFDERAVVLADDGGEISTENLMPSHIRDELYSDAIIARRITEISDFKMNYELLISKDEVHQLPIKRLLVSATKNALMKSECEEDYFFHIPISESEVAIINANKNSDQPICFFYPDRNVTKPYSLIQIDIRYLFGLLTSVYHWNNAEIGSQYNIRRNPNILNRSAQLFLNFFAI